MSLSTDRHHQTKTSIVLCSSYWSEVSLSLDQIHFRIFPPWGRGEERGGGATSTVPPSRGNSLFHRFPCSSSVFNTHDLASPSWVEVLTWYLLGELWAEWSRGVNWSQLLVLLWDITTYNNRQQQQVMWRDSFGQPRGCTSHPLPGGQLGCASLTNQWPQTIEALTLWCWYSVINDHHRHNTRLHN